MTDTVVPHEISPDALIGDSPDEGEVVELSPGQPEPLPYDQLLQSPVQHHYIHPHESADDVTIVAAKQGDDSTDWIGKFCEDLCVKHCTYHIFSC